MKNRITYSLIFLGLFSASLALKAQYLHPSSPASAGMSEERLTIMDDHIDRYIEMNALPGGVFLVARKGKIVYFKSFGDSSIESIKSYNNDDIFRLASMTKAVTTVAIMQLYEQGKLGLDDPIFHYIPAFADAQVLDTFNDSDSTYTTVPATRPITIRQLLTHTSGITYGGFNPGKIQAVYEQFDMNDVGLFHQEWTTEEFIDRLAEVPLAFDPGSKYMYGLNMDVLGRIVEVVSGQELDEYFAKYIFEPLGMVDTYFNLPAAKHDRLVPIYSFDEEGNSIMIEPDEESGMIDYPKLEDNMHYAGGGGLSGTTMDYARFTQALLNGGVLNGRRILGRKTIETMTSDQLMIQNAQGTGFSKLPGITHSLGFALLTEEGEGWNNKSAGTYEWGGYFNTKFFIDPKEELIFVGMTQIVPFKRPDFWDRLYSIVYGAIVD